MNKYIKWKDDLGPCLWKVEDLTQGFLTLTDKLFPNDCVSVSGHLTYST